MMQQMDLKRSEIMHIDVIMKDGTYHHFTPRVLDVLLDTNRVMKFKRMAGWVTVGMDPVRMRSKPGFNGTGTYQGPERRVSH